MPRSPRYGRARRVDAAGLTVRGARSQQPPLEPQRTGGVGTDPLNDALRLRLGIGCYSSGALADSAATALAASRLAHRHRRECRDGHRQHDRGRDADRE